MTAGTALPIAALGNLLSTAERLTGSRSSMKTFSKIGKGLPILDGHHEATLFEHTGNGCLSHMWFGGDWKKYGETRIRVYVDGETTPSIDMELGLGHGDGFNSHGPWGGPRMGKTGNAGGIYNTYRIPFGHHIRVTGQRHPDGPPTSPFWWIMRGTEGLAVTLGELDFPNKPDSSFTRCLITSQNPWRNSPCARPKLPVPFIKSPLPLRV